MLKLELSSKSIESKKAYYNNIYQEQSPIPNKWNVLKESINDIKNRIDTFCLEDQQYENNKLQLRRSSSKGKYISRASSRSPIRINKHGKLGPRCKNCMDLLFRGIPTKNCLYCK